MTFYTTFTTADGIKAAYIYQTKRQLIAADQIGRGLKNTFGNMELARKQIAEEIDKICIIAKWDIAIAKYNGGWKND